MSKLIRISDETVDELGTIIASLRGLQATMATQPNVECYGYDLDYLVQFASVCAAAGITPKELELCTRNMNLACDWARRKFEEQIEKTMNNIFNNGK